MTDPRIAALAEALTAEIVEIEEERLLLDCIADTCGHPDGECPDPPGVNCGDGQRLAAAILAALPPDWCGHDPEPPKMADPPGAAEMAEWMTQWQREITRNRSLVADRDAEIARLRKIEEAARALMTPHTLTTTNPPKGEPTAGWEWPEWDALRAALEDR